MYCPNCRVEYREGFTTCADCGIPLVSSKPPEPQLPTDESDVQNSFTEEPDLQLVTVLTGTDPLVLACAKGLLEDAEIPFYTRDEIRHRAGPWWIEVGADREEEARSLLARFAP